MTSTQGLFHAYACMGVTEGICVILTEENDEIVYAGPLTDAPDVAGKIVLMHASDFARLQGYTNERKH
jgi:hypothetical protein